MPDVDLFWRSSGEQRTSNFLLWQSAYAEMVFDDVLWPDVDRRDLWRAIETYASRERRYGGAVDTPDDTGRARSARGRPRLTGQWRSQVPNSSRVWLMSRKPCWPATASAHCSTAGPSTSTVRPHSRQTRWWWCVPDRHRR